MRLAWVFICFSIFLQGASSQNPPAVPDNIKPPGDVKLVLKAHASGEQIYICQPTTSGDSPFAWALSGPEAKLFDEKGKEIAKHYAGPTWQFNDGSSVTGNVVSEYVPDPNSIPWLLLSGVDHGGDGVVSKASSIQRINTKGGKAPATGCDSSHDGEKTRTSYSADYYFYAPSH
jgi:Protein of unknown function (DUF3455)